MTQNILIIGATSGIAEALARRYAEQGDRLFLVARNSQKLSLIASDLCARGAAEVKIYELDLNETDAIPLMLKTAWSAFEHFDIALIAHGTLPNQSRTETDLDYVTAQLRTNAASTIVCLAGLAIQFEPQGQGVIAVISSVAGDRGRASNYLYGSAKAAISTYASGLRARLCKKGVHVLTIKPGFVNTPMTAELNLPGRLSSTPEAVAIDIQHAIANRKNVLYTPWFWRWIMCVICLIPEFLFKKTQL